MYNFNFDRECIRNESRYPKSERHVIDSDRDSPRFDRAHPKRLRGPSEILRVNL